MVLVVDLAAEGAFLDEVVVFCAAGEGLTSLTAIVCVERRLDWRRVECARGCMTDEDGVKISFLQSAPYIPTDSNQSASLILIATFASFQPPANQF